MTQVIQYEVETKDADSQIKICQLPVLEDNFIFVVTEQSKRQAFVVDPAIAEPVEDFLASEKLELIAILNTHHHGDHVGANLELSAHWPGLKIYGSAQDCKRIPGLTRGFVDGEKFRMLGQDFTVFETFGHTIGHIIFVMNPDSRVPEAFVGDTLFGAGCGKLFEGSFEQMLGSLKKIRALPKKTRVWCAHEYTEKNLWVACQLEPGNQSLSEHYRKTQAKRQQNAYSVPLSLSDELLFNPFLRWDSQELKSTTKTKTDLETFTFVRRFRDQF